MRNLNLRRTISQYIYIYIFRDLYENLESEEEYMRDEERKLIAVIKIQVNTKYFEFS